MRLTEEGRRAAAGCREVLGPMMRELTDGLDDERLSALSQGLEVLAERIEARVTQVPPCRRGPTQEES